MEREEIYQFIGDLAICLYNKKIKISLSSLNQILADAGREAEYGSNRGLASAVSAAYDRFEATDPVIHHAIAHTFMNKDGEPPWQNYE